LLFFFFQAEDGIRDGHVTGVQTCALPILVGAPPAVGREGREESGALALLLLLLAVGCGIAGEGAVAGAIAGVFALLVLPLLLLRSEERRVGKECWCGRVGW